jgi:hypothetical protein
VQGTISPLEEMFPQPFLPIAARPVLLPFEDKIITDGLYQNYPVSFGPGFRRMLNETYRNAKAAGMFYKTLCQPESKTEKVKQEDQENDNLLYNFTVYPSNMYRKVRAKVQISGDYTMDDLADLILDTFNFDNDHLYKFILGNNIHSRDNKEIFDPRCEDIENPANKIKVSEFRLSPYSCV